MNQTHGAVYGRCCKCISRSNGQIYYRVAVQPFDPVLSISLAEPLRTETFWRVAKNHERVALQQRETPVNANHSLTWEKRTVRAKERGIQID
jgi:hypothetical protein